MNDHADISESRRRRFRLRVAFVRQDCWIGLYWKRHETSSPPGTDPIVTYYVCFLPCLPLIVERYR